MCTRGTSINSDIIHSCPRFTTIWIKLLLHLIQGHRACIFTFLPSFCSLPPLSPFFVLLLLYVILQRSPLSPGAATFFPTINHRVLRGALSIFGPETNEGRSKYSPHKMDRCHEEDIFAACITSQQKIVILYYRVIYLVMDLGWVDFDLGVPKYCRAATAASAKFPTAQAELGRQWNK